jgi:hypothetical protein
MKFDSRETLSQAVISKTIAEYGWHLFWLTMCGVFTEWIPAVGGFLLGFALRLLQDHYGYSIKNDGWFKVYWPWVLAFVLVCLYHAFRASWKIHQATTRTIAVQRLNNLLIRGDNFAEDFDSACANGKDFWSKHVNLWEETVATLLANNFGQSAKERFRDLRDVVRTTGEPINHQEMLRCWRKNLAVLLIEFAKK